MAKRLNLGSIRISLTDIELGITKSPYQLEPSGKSAPEDVQLPIVEPPKSLRKPKKPYVKIILKNTPHILLYEQPSLTELRNTDEGRQVERDNRELELLKEGKNSYFRRKQNMGVQTTAVLYKTRDVNTEKITKQPVGSYVSNFEMFDTYKHLLEKSTESIAMDGIKKMEVITYKVRGVDTFVKINESASFKLALMLTMRLLASNVYEQQQRRFRNMALPDPLALEVRYNYRLDLLWRFTYPGSMNNVCKAVADMSWCPCNGDILAAAYGIYTYSDVRTASQAGCVYIWNIKNPVNPERCYSYDVPVVTVEFSPSMRPLLVVGLYDGTVQVLDISDMQKPPIAVSERNAAAGCEPVIAIQWLRVGENDMEKSDIPPFLAVSQDGTVTKYRIINSPYLLSQQQIRLDRVESNPEGLTRGEVASSVLRIQANRHPQCLNICLDPVHDDLYYVLTDEGCLHKCSTNYPQQHLQVLQVHVAGANVMEFSPWSPKLFLTCGNDWYIHIWMMGIFKPLITLQHGVAPVHYASWSKTHSTIIVSINQKTIDVWDLRRSTLKPVSSTVLDNGLYTLGKFTLCGRSMAVGNERGNILMCAFENMPFSPYYQYDELEAALMEALSTKPDLCAALESMGFFDYAGEKRRQASGSKVKQVKLTKQF